jgi:benzoyl-CoA reductase/2-hydroxyglutaryl-CoA dehydratase subunit BcrC/BadD/HgdB
MTTITASIPDNLKDKVRKFIEELGGEVISESKLSRKKALLKELEEAFSEAKEIKDGKKQGLTLEQILLAE